MGGNPRCAFTIARANGAAPRATGLQLRVPHERTAVHRCNYSGLGLTSRCAYACDNVHDCSACSRNVAACSDAASFSAAAPAAPHFTPNRAVSQCEQSNAAQWKYRDSVEAGLIALAGSGTVSHGEHVVIAKRCLTLALLAAAFALPSLLHHTILHVVTPSIPPGWYFVERFGSPRITDYVVACLPASIALLGLRRGYLIPGDCPNNVAPLVKVLAAAAGDTVKISPNGVFVNGTRAAASPASRDSHGVFLFPQHFGTYRIKTGTVFLLGTSTHSWDSRYFGALSSQSIIGRAHPVIINPSAVPQ